MKRSRSDLSNNYVLRLLFKCLHVKIAIYGTVRSVELVVHFWNDVGPEGTYKQPAGRLKRVKHFQHVILSWSHCRVGGLPGLYIEAIVIKTLQLFFVINIELKNKS